MDGVQEFCGSSKNRKTCNEQMYLKCLLTIGNPETIPWNSTTNTVVVKNATNLKNTTANSTTNVSSISTISTTTSSIEVESNETLSDSESADKRLAEMVETLRQQLLVSWSLQCGTDEII